MNKYTGIRFNCIPQENCIFRFFKTFIPLQGAWKAQAYRTEFPERAKTKDVKRRLRTAFVKFDKAALTKKFNQPASRHRAFNKDAAKQKCARAKVRAKVVKRMRAIRAEAKADAA